MRVLGIDPGIRSYSWGLLDRGVPKKAGTLVSTIDKNVSDDAGFINEYLELLICLKPHQVVCERYTHRGFQSVYSEQMNQMIGRMAILTIQETGKPLVQIRASDWKNSFKIKKLQRGSFDMFPQDQEILKSVHIADAFCIALFSYLKTFK